MTDSIAHTLTNPQNGNLAFKIFSFEDGNLFDHIQRNNYYSLIWIQEGNGLVKADFSAYSFLDNSLFAFAPYQPFMFLGADIKGTVINFHPDFFCIHKHQAEVACNGVLFNNIYEPPFIIIDPSSAATLHMLIAEMKTAVQNVALAQYELIISYLKIFLITTARLKTQQQTAAMESIKHLKEPFVLQELKSAIEKNFKTAHAAGDYAKVLNISTKALAKITKTHLNKTLTALIAEWIIIEAKRELYLTNKAVKQIAFELGYEDEYYFSRFFKTNAAISPQIYRDTVGFGRASTS